MKRILTAEQMRAVDAAAAQHGMPGGVLMENAGQWLAKVAASQAGPTARFCVLCGPGNNGGDGFVAARALLAERREVWLELVGEASRLPPEAQRNLAAWTASGGRVQPVPASVVRSGDVVIDALLGTGVSRAPEGAMAEAIRRVKTWRTLGARVISADLPSGLESTKGVPFDPCVEADHTVAFGFLKLGQALEPGASLSGRVECADIGIPQAATASLAGPGVWLVEESDAMGRLPPRSATGHKGTYGHVLVLAGSPGHTGAAALAGLAALRGGAGLVTVASRTSELGHILTHAPELMGLAVAGQGGFGSADAPSLLAAREGKDAIVVGPGLGHGPTTSELIIDLLAGTTPAVLDADALNAFAGRASRLAGINAPLVLTPHPGEAARLLGWSIIEVQVDRLRSARRLAELSGAVVVLKGARSVIATPAGEAFINPTGNPGMGTAGAGDVLAGLCGALLGQGLSPVDAAIVATFAHGKAGDLAAKRSGRVGLIASDLLTGLREVWVSWNR